MVNLHQSRIITTFINVGLPINSIVFYDYDMLYNYLVFTIFTFFHSREIHVLVYVILLSLFRMEMQLMRNVRMSSNAELLFPWWWCFTGRSKWFRLCRDGPIINSSHLWVTGESNLNSLRQMCKLGCTRKCPCPHGDSTKMQLS